MSVLFSLPSEMRLVRVEAGAVNIDYEGEAKEIAVHGYVIKPLDRATLLLEVREAFARFQSGGSLA